MGGLAKGRMLKVSLSRRARLRSVCGEKLV